MSNLTAEVDGPKAFIECLIPVTACNMRCSYCYVIQENRRQASIANLPCSLEQIKYALRRERFGGICFFNLCGAGETLLPQYTIDIAKVLLENGHFINITTNGTLSKRFDELINRLSRDEMERCSFSFSLHYLELKRLGVTDQFFDNIRKVRAAGASTLVQVNLCDEYLPYIDEIKQLCLKNVGALPQVAATRAEEGFPAKRANLMTKLSSDEYRQIGDSFDSPLFTMTMNNFNVKRKEFCYNGDWAYVLNFESGLLHRCYCSAMVQNILLNPDEPIMKCAVGNKCNSLYCYNSTHFIGIGTIPDIDSPTYVALRDRPEAQWYSERMRAFLSHKLSENNEQYSGARRFATNCMSAIDSVAYNLYGVLTRIKHRAMKNKGM